MQTVSDDLLLSMAEIAATLIGLLLVGAFFYLETGFRRLTILGPAARPYLRATTKVIMLLYSSVLVLALALVALDRLWTTLLLAVLTVAVLASLVEWTFRSRALRRVIRLAGAAPWAAWLLTLPPLVLPWAIGGPLPEREHLAVALLLLEAIAFMNTLGLVLIAFDLSSLERSAQGNGAPSDAKGSRGDASPGTRRAAQGEPAPSPGHP